MFQEGILWSKDLKGVGGSWPWRFLTVFQVGDKAAAKSLRRNCA